MMTPTSEERREVAARLRDDNHGYGTEYDFFLHALGMSREGRGPCDWAKVHKRLADLIDPTCQIVTDQVDDGEWGAHETYVCCSNCGNQNMFDRFTRKPHRFCPHCGARVVSGNESGR